MRISSEMGLQNQQLKVDTIANNIANINTVGFKATLANVSTAYDDQENSANKAVFGGIPSIGSAAKITNNGTLYSPKRVDFSEGNIVDTGNPLDLAIQGKGFFQVQLDDGRIAYTRAGDLQTDAENNIVNGQGNLIVPKIQVPANASDIKIKPNGQIAGMIPTQSDPNQTEEKVLGQITLANFDNPDGLQQIGGNLYTETESSGKPQKGNPGSEGFGGIRSGSLEQSNTDLGTSMTNLILAQRAYQMEARMVQDGDEMWAQANALRR